MVPFWGRCTTHFSGWIGDVDWGYGILILTHGQIPIAKVDMLHRSRCFASCGSPAAQAGRYLFEVKIVEILEPVDSQGEWQVS